MRNSFVFLLAVLMTGCAGREANPVPAYRVGDEGITCAEIQAEMAHIDTQVATLLPESKKTGKNVALGVTGWFFIVPWFFMDFSEAEKIEIRAYQERYLALEKLYARNNCTEEGGEQPQLVMQSEEAMGAVERMRELDALKEEGLITEEEYAERRQAVLDGLSISAPDEIQTQGIGEEP